MPSKPSREKYAHLVARAYHLPVTLVDEEVAHWLWPRLQRRFPLALACVLMPNHSHLVTPASSVESVQHELSALLGSMARSGGVRQEIRFEPLPPVLLDDDPVKLARQVRYAALNPQRAGLSRDPLAWLWSTHRDAVGMVARPWVTADRLAASLGRPHEDFARTWHEYVAREDGILLDARALPTPAAPTPFAAYPLEAVADAVAQSMRARVTDIRQRGPVRDLFLVVAPLVGWTSSSLLARYCDVTPRSVQRSFLRPPPVAIEAALLCLGAGDIRRDVRTSRVTTLAAR